MLSSVEHPEASVDDFNKLSSEQRRVVLPSFSQMMKHVHEMAQKRLAKSSTCVVVGKTKLAFTLEVYEEVCNLKNVY